MGKHALLPHTPRQHRHPRPARRLHTRTHNTIHTPRNHQRRIHGKVYEIMGFKQRVTFKRGMVKIITFNTQEEYERMVAKYPDAKFEKVYDDEKDSHWFWGQK